MKRMIHFVPLLFLLCLSGWLKAQTLTQVEYFFDTDPGVGKGTAINITTPADSVNQTFSIPVGSLPAGFHRLFLRTKNNNGTWGLQQPGEFTILPVANAPAPQISGGEYFFDTDPGIGKGTPVTVSVAADSENITQGVPVGALSPGFHHLYFRWQYANGTWGIEDGRDFTILPVANAPSPQISGAEYFFDTDPGLGNGLSLTVSAADSVNIMQGVPANGLSQGFHHLYVRFRYANGTWGLEDGRDFYVSNVLGTDSSPKINYVEYFVDSDPGIGNGTGIAITPAADSVNVLEGIPMTGLTHGGHLLYARFRYTNGIWGLYQPGDSSTFSICIPPVDSIIALGATTYCKGGSVTLSSDTSNIWTKYQWQLNGVNLTGDSATTLVVTDTGGIYNMVVEDTAGCFGTSDSITVTVPAASLSWASLVGAEQLNVSGSDTAICEGHTVTLSGGSPSGGTYSGDSVTGNTLFAYTGSGSDVITYTVTVDGCVVSASDALNFTICTGINPLGPDYGVSLYPNPALDVLVLQSSYFETTEVKPVLYDITGQLVTTAGFTRQTDKFTYNTSSLPGGIYFIKLNVAGNEVTKMFVKVE